MGQTSISYVLNPDGTPGRSLNPLVGCPLLLVSEGCRSCWARESHNRRYRALLAGKSMPSMYAKPFDGLQWFPERLNEPLRVRKPTTWAVGFQTDIALATRGQLQNLLGVMRDQERHIFLLLTKRPTEFLAVLKRCQEVRSYCWPIPNVWLGVTVCTQDEADRNIPLLLRTPAGKRWVSYEPALSPILIKWWLNGCHESGNKPDWLVCGGESGAKARPMHPEWVRSVRDQCADARVPFYFKGWGDAVGIGWGLPGNPWHDAGWSTHRDHGHLLDGQEHRALPWRTP